MNDINENIITADEAEAVQQPETEALPQEKAEEDITEPAEGVQEECTEQADGRELPEEVEEEQQSDIMAGLLHKLCEQSAQIAELTKKTDALSMQIAAGNKAIAVHEEIERNLNNELQRYKNDFYDKLATPFLMQFIGLYIDITDEMAEIKEEYEARPENEHLKTQLDSLSYYADSIKGALINNGVEIKTPEAGSSYDYKEQRISKTVHTDDEALKDCIAQTRSSAFVYNGKVLRPAKVVVYKV